MFPIGIISLNSESEAMKDSGAAVPFRVSYGHRKMFPPLSDGSTHFCTSPLLSEVINHELNY